MSNEMYIGDLGSGTVVGPVAVCLASQSCPICHQFLAGSAAFNLLVISAVCVCAIPDGEAS